MSKQLSLLLVMLALAGCATLDEGVDPVLVRAEQSIRVGRGTIDRFLKWEKENRIWLHDPAIKKAADEIRASAPLAIDEALAARDIYKLTREEADADTLDKVLSALSKIAARAQAHFKPTGR